MNIRKMSASDWPAVAKIYTEGIATGFATFETSTPSYEAWNTAHMSTCRIVATENDMVLGWAALSPVSNRCVYGGVAEVSIYISSQFRSKGVGKLLMKILISAS